MRYYNYLNEDAISRALSLPEPKVGGQYAHEKVRRYLELINAALKEMESKEESDANDAIESDLRDKKKKWSNVNKETKPTKTKLEIPPDQQDEEPISKDQEKQQPQQKESSISKFFKKMF